MAALDYVGIWQFQADLALAGWEYGAKLATAPFLHLSAPSAESARPVMTFPGFTGAERSLGPLNRFLESKGYTAGSWGLGSNWGHRNVTAMRLLIDTLAKRVEMLADRHGSQVSLVGHSLGGIYAREVARARPDLVDRVITLGTPANPHPDFPERLNQSVSAVFDAVTGRPGEDNALDMVEIGVVTPPPGVPLVSIFSPFDGVVSEEASRIPDELLTDASGAARENLRITGSHTGMIVNPLALLAVADRLQADPANWRAYERPSWFSGWPQSMTDTMPAAFKPLK